MTEPTLAETLHAYAAEARFGTTATSRYRLAFADWGEVGAPAVVFIHGLSDQARSFSLVMQPLVAAGFRAVAYELADGGGDGAVLGNYRHADYVADLLALLDHLKLDRVHLAGSSFGSTITLRALAEHPARFGASAIQGGFARRPLARLERALAQFARYFPGRMGDLPGRKQAMAKLDGPQFAASPAERYRFLLENAARSPIRAVARRGLILNTLDLRPLLPSITQPLLMLGGDRDLIVPRWCEAEVEAGVPRTRRVEFAACGHYPQYTRPREVAAELAAFFREAA